MEVLKILQFKIVLIFLTYIFLLSCQKQEPIKQIEVSINPNIETIACLYSLTQKGAEMGYGYGSPPLRNKVMEQFSHLKNHPAVKRTADFLDRGFWAPPLWASLYSSPFPEGQLLHELPQWVYEQASPNKDIEDGKKRINAYMELANDFYREARFSDFIKKHEEEYRNIVEDVRRNLPDKNFVTTMEQYYGNKNKSYTLIPSPIMLEFAGIGAGIITGEGMMAYNIFGASIKRAVKDSIEKGERQFNLSDYTFDDPERIRELTIHEFGHGFVNPIAEKYRVEINRYSYLFEPIRERMTELTYLNWWNCAVEHIIRAGEVRIALAMGHKESAQRLMKDYTETYQFIYLPQIVSALEEYEQNRAVFPTIEAYFPELVKAFEVAAPE